MSIIISSHEEDKKINSIILCATFGASYNYPSFYLDHIHTSSFHFCYSDGKIPAVLFSNCSSL